MTNDVIAGCEPNSASPVSVCAIRASGSVVRKSARTPNAAIVIVANAQTAAAASRGSKASGSSARATWGG
jgi:hypothetical protein